MPMVLTVVGLETLYLEDIQAASEGETDRQFSGLVKDEKKADLAPWDEDADDGLQSDISKQFQTKNISKIFRSKNKMI